jgi:hypothetical protein
MEGFEGEERLMLNWCCFGLVEVLFSSVDVVHVLGL